MKEKETPQAQGTSVSPQDVTGTKFSQFKKIESSENLEVVGVEGPVNVRMPLRTSNIATDPDVTLFDDEETPELKTQLEVNRYLASKIDGVEFPPGTIVSDEAPEDPEEGLSWYDTVRLELFVFTGEAWLPCSPLGARVEQGEVLQAQIVEQIQKSLQDQEVLEEKIEAGEKEQEKLKDKVAALEGSTGSYQYKFSLTNSNPRSGDFITKSGIMEATTSPADVKYIYFGELDSDGRTPNFDGIKTGDVFRITGPAGEKVEWRVAANANNESKVISVGDLLSSSVDEFADEVLYGVTDLSAFDPTGLATIDYVDERVDTKLETTGDSMTGVLDMKDNYIAGVKDAASDTDAVNRRTMKKNMEGVLRQDASGHTAVDQPFRIRAKSDGDAYWTYIRLDNNEISMYHMADPKEWHHAAHRRYVDDTFADAASKKEANTFKETQTFAKTAYFQNSIVHNGKNADTITEVRGEHEDGTKQLWHKIRGTNRVSWICYPGQSNDGYKKCLEMEWDAETSKPIVKLDYLQPPTAGRHPATKQYVDEEIARAGGGSFAETGPATPELQAGQLFYNTTDKVLYIGE